jgi:hypothetical protein
MDAARGGRQQILKMHHVCCRKETVNNCSLLMMDRCRHEYMSSMQCAPA